MRSASHHDADARPAAAAGDEKELKPVSDGRAAHARWLCVRDAGTSEQIGDPRADHVNACARNRLCAVDGGRRARRSVARASTSLPPASTGRHVP